MMHSAELAFVVKLLDSYHVPLHIYDRSGVENFMFDFGLRRRIYKDVDYGKILEYILGSIKDKTLYRIEDAFKCRYLCFLIPGASPRAMAMVGPYYSSEIDSPEIREIMNVRGIPAPFFDELVTFYHSITYTENENNIMSILYTLGDVMWGGQESFNVEDIKGVDHENGLLWELQSGETRDPMLSMELLEKRYEAENEFIQAVAHGHSHKADAFLANITAGQLEK